MCVLVIHVRHFDSYLSSYLTVQLPGSVPVNSYLDFMDLNLQHLSGTLVTAAFGSFVVVRLCSHALYDREELHLRLNG